MNKLFAKLAQIQAELKSIPETGRNQHFGYNYASVEDVLNAVRPVCSEHGIFISINCVSHEILKDGRAASVVVQLTLTDVESSESVTSQCPGYSEDPKSDKSLWKAISGASKYVIRTFFALASGGDDPEQEDVQPTLTKPATATSNGKVNRPTANSLQSAESAATTNGKSAQPVTGNGNAAPRPPQNQPTPPSSPAANNNGGLPPSILEQTTEQMRRIGWTIDQGRRFLQETFGVLSRKHLTAGQLRQFLDFLRSQPSPRSPVPVPS